MTPPDSHLKGHPTASGIGSSREATFGSDGDGMDQGETTVTLGQTLDGVFFPDLGTDIFRDSSVAVDEIALAVEAGCQYGVADAHAEVEDVDDYLQNRGDDPSGARRSDDS